MKILTYPTSEAAESARYYDYAFVRDFDILVIESEGIVGVVLVTVRQGELHSFCHDWPQYDFQQIRRLTKAVDFAVAEATRRGFEVDPQFILTIDDEPVVTPKLNSE
jgi:hypothetical protein